MSSAGMVVKLNIGQDKQANALANGLTPGTTGTATATTATTLTDSSASWTTNAWAGRVIICGAAYGVVVSNTPTAVTLDRWYNPTSPTGSVASPPTAGRYVILTGNAPVFNMAISASTTAPVATDTTLAGEITTAGLARQPASFAHTAGANSYTLTGSWVVVSADLAGGSVTVSSTATFDALTGGIPLHKALLANPQTVTTIGQTVVVTETVTM